VHFWRISTASEIFITNNAQSLECLLGWIGLVPDFMGHYTFE